MCTERMGGRPLPSQQNCVWAGAGLLLHPELTPNLR